MVIIKVLNLVPDCYSWGNGNIVGQFLHAELSTGRSVTLSFEGVKDVPSSFVNAAFVPLIDSFGLSCVKNQLSVVKSNRQINDMIRHRLEFEANRDARVEKECEAHR